MSARAQRESARRVSDCVTALLNDQPFFGSLALRLPIRPDSTRSTLASDGREICYSPAWVAETDADFIKTAIARVVLSCALKHHTRRGERDGERWQHASQLVTHGLLRDAGFRLPPDAEAWDGLSVEQAYDRLPPPEDAEAQPPSGPGDPPSPQAGKGAGQGGDDSDPSADEGGSDEPGDAGAAPDDTPCGPTGQSTGDPDGPASDAPDAPAEDAGQAPQSFDPAGTGELMDSSGPHEPGSNGQPTPSDVNEQEQDWDEAMHQALSLAKAQGKVPGAVQETVEAAHVSTFDWRTLLRLYITDTAASDYSWSRPNRRFIDSGLYLPSIRSEGMAALAIIIDTSGSVDTDTLAEFWSEIRELADEIAPERVIVLQVDAVLQDEQDYAPSHLPERIRVKGRWGTDFRPGFAHLEDNGIEPAVCLYFTDMECDDYPEAEPPFPVIWCDYGDGTGLASQPPPWGERIRIAD